jgi:hypothetical protein
MTIAGVEDMGVARWLTSTLGGDTTLMTATPGGLWDGAAIEGTPYPIVRFDPQSPGIVVRGVGPIEIMVNSLWLIRAVTVGPEFGPIIPIASRLHALIQGATGLTLPEGTLVSCVREQPFRLESVQGGREFRHLGGIYRIFIQA